MAHLPWGRVDLAGGGRGCEVLLRSPRGAAGAPGSHAGGAATQPTGGLSTRTSRNHAGGQVMATTATKKGKKEKRVQHPPVGSNGLHVNGSQPRMTARE